MLGSSQKRYIYELKNGKIPILYLITKLLQSTIHTQIRTWLQKNNHQGCGGKLNDVATAKARKNKPPHQELSKATIN